MGQHGGFSSDPVRQLGGLDKYGIAQGSVPSRIIEMMNSGRISHDAHYCLRTIQQGFRALGMRAPAGGHATDTGPSFVKMGYRLLDNKRNARPGDFAVWRAPLGDDRSGHIGILVWIGGKLRLYSNMSGTVKSSDAHLYNNKCEVYRFVGR